MPTCSCSTCEGDFKVRTLKAAQSSAKQTFVFPYPTVLAGRLAPIVSVALPSPPSTPAFPPPSIAESDLSTFIEPLVMNGWSIGAIAHAKLLHSGGGELPGRHPCLRRVYRFHDYPSARHFFHTIVAAIQPTPNSLAGIRAALFTDLFIVEVVSFSKLAEGAPENKKYGISHIDVRFAIEVETEFTKNWAGSANNVGHIVRKAPTTMEEVWNHPIIRRSKRRKDPAGSSTPSE
ncbi:hypothetical protein FB451DRAFT_486137 [Mycena latifolia]|nr:hypothetical protein FB451DRAFT_486137 [Mycena latifolia]